jgi:hypothetical protein
LNFKGLFPFSEEKAMTWSVSASGKKADVKQSIEKQLESAGHPTVAAALCALVDDACGATGTHASVSGSGSTTASISISTWKDTPATVAP